MLIGALIVRIGILSKRKHMFTGELRKYLESMGHSINIYTRENLQIDDNLLENDFYILKSKQLMFLYAGFFLKSHNIPVFPDPEISYKQKNRIESHFLIKNAGLQAPNIFLGIKNIIKKKIKKKDYPIVVKPLMGSGSRHVYLINIPNELNFKKEKILYVEKYIEGKHILVYFIGDLVRAYEKIPFSDEHSSMRNIGVTKKINNIISRWKNKYNLQIGHLDIVIEKDKGIIYIVDTGSFPEFSQWDINPKPPELIWNIILKSYKNNFDS